jgi:hypothetical protein
MARTLAIAAVTVPCSDHFWVVNFHLPAVAFSDWAAITLGAHAVDEELA